MLAIIQNLLTGEAVPTILSDVANVKAEIGIFLGYGASPSRADLVADIERLYLAGLRRMCKPPVLPGMAAAHRWTWLTPVGTMTLHAPYSTGTLAITHGGDTVTLTGGVFPSWVSADSTLTIGGVDYAIDSRDSDTQITLAANWTPASVSAATYTVTPYPDYWMPRKFGGLVGPMFYSSGTHQREVQHVPLSRVLAYRQMPNVSAFPQYVAFNTEEYSPGEVARIRAYFWPLPAADYVLTYSYRLIPDKTTDELPWPPGQPEFTELLIESCLSVAEERRNDEAGLHSGKFLEALATAIAHDVNDNTPDRFGNIHGRGGGDSRVTYRPTFTFNGIIQE